MNVAQVKLNMEWFSSKENLSFKFFRKTHLLEALLQYWASCYRHTDGCCVVFALREAYHMSSESPGKHNISTGVVVHLKCPVKKMSQHP